MTNTVTAKTTPEEKPKQTRKPRARVSVRVLVEREFVGDKTVSEALLPVILEDLRKRAETLCTLDKQPETS